MYIVVNSSHDVHCSSGTTVTNTDETSRFAISARAVHLIALEPKVHSFGTLAVLVQTYIQYRLLRQEVLYRIKTVIAIARIYNDNTIFVKEREEHKRATDPRTTR